MNELFHKRPPSNPIIFTSISFYAYIYIGFLSSHLAPPIIPYWELVEAVVPPWEAGVEEWEEAVE